MTRTGWLTDVASLEELAIFRAMSIRITHAEAAARVFEILSAIVASTEWSRYSGSLAAMSWMDGRDQFRRFFDVFEGQSGEDWLGIMEWAVIEEIRLSGEGLGTNLAASTNFVVARMAGHPDIEVPQ